MIRLVAAAALAFCVVGTGAGAQTMDHSMHGMPMPSEKPLQTADQAATAAPDAAPPPEAVGTDLQPGSGSAPDAPTDRYADRFWSPTEMARSRDQVHREHGAMTVSQVMFDILEIQPRHGDDVLRWNAEGWIGGDINRLVISSEGEARLGDGVEEAEVQALYGRALDAYWNLRAGVRQDLGQGPDRTYATIGVEGLAPYWFELDGALFVSNKGDVLARAEASYDQRITQRLILQPRVEINASAQDIPETRTGSGLSEVSADLRLRYEIRHEFAPYVGVSWERRLGRTGDYARADGEGRGGVRFVAGVRTWF